jgi:hypothetical protein
MSCNTILSNSVPANVVACLLSTVDEELKIVSFSENTENVSDERVLGKLTGAKIDCVGYKTTRSLDMLGLANVYANANPKTVGNCAVYIGDNTHWINQTNMISTLAPQAILLTVCNKTRNDMKLLKFLNSSCSGYRLSESRTVFTTGYNPRSKTCYLYTK